MMNNKRRNTNIVIGLVAIAATINIFIFVRNGDRLPIPVGDPSLDGYSRSLDATKVVPTLDASIDRQSNIVWCASFLAAWKVLETDVAMEPLSLQGSPEIALALDRASDPRPHIPEEILYAAAGWNQNGITDRITKDLAQKFPGKIPPAFQGIAPNSIVAYAYLEANVKFSMPYFQNRQPLIFTDSGCVKTELSSFGIRPENTFAYLELRRQPEILFEVRDENYKLTEFVVDLDRTSTPNQIILALVAPKPTLAETLAAVEDKIDSADGKEGYDGLGSNDVLLVPDMMWRISHRFTELEGREFANPKLKGQMLNVAQQDTRFRLDRSGAELKSEANIYATLLPTYYVFDRPFLLYMKKRGAEMPYFVMWIQNAELLSSWEITPKPRFVPGRRR